MARAVCPVCSVAELLVEQKADAGCLREVKRPIEVTSGIKRNKECQSSKRVTISQLIRSYIAMQKQKVRITPIDACFVIMEEAGSTLGA